MNQDKKKFCLWGYSGHGYVVGESIKRSGADIVFYIDLKESMKNPFQLERFSEVLEKDFYSLNKEVIVFPSVGASHIRRWMVDEIRQLNVKEGVVIDPTAIISTDVQIGLSTFISSRVVLNPCSRIGEGAIVNTGAIIEHECIIGDYAHVGPGAVLAGNVRVGVDSFIGANSSLKQGVKVGDNVTIGAGSVVISDIPDNGVWVGCPVRRIR